VGVLVVLAAEDTARANFSDSSFSLCTALARAKYQVAVRLAQPSVVIDAGPQLFVRFDSSLCPPHCGQCSSSTEEEVGQKIRELEEDLVLSEAKVSLLSFYLQIPLDIEGFPEHNDAGRTRG